MAEVSEAAVPLPPTIKDKESFPNDTVRILLATDNHIGYMERDPIRGQDSINTFKEILQLAVKNDVDFILLAGDLFHENKPSRECLYKTIALLREYTMGSKPVQVELLSNPEDGQADGFSFPAINYEDPNLNVGIPVYSIHGNHDDPQGAGAAGALCALDVLSVSGLLNYMGKSDLPLSNGEDGTASGIAVKPILLRKGNTHLAMYGVGNVKDQRMHFELRSNRVKMFMPKNKQKWFNLLLLHQNRVKHGPQEFVPEGRFDDSIDLIVWGHEHDCRIVPEPVGGKNYYITQPGSSVATSLADGEAIEKHVALLSIQGKEFEVKPLPLRTVRPFVIEEIVLSELSEDEVDLNSQVDINKFLKQRVNSLIEKANQQWDERNARAVEQGEEKISRMLPLIRLKVETTGVSEMSNPVRFGQEFHGRIANPRDVLVFHRQKKAAKRGAKVMADEPELSIDNPDLTISEKLAKVRVSTLVKEYLSAQELQLLAESGMSDAIHMFVEKDDTHAISTHVGKELKYLMKGVGVQATDNLTEEELEGILNQAKEDHEKELQEKKQKQKQKAKAKAKDSDAESMDSMMMDVDADATGYVSVSEPEPQKKKKAPAKSKSTTTSKATAKKAPAKGRGKKAKESESESEDIVEIDDDEDEEEPPKPAKKTNRATVLSQPAKKAPAKKKTAAAPKQSQLTFAPAGRSSRAAATKARGKMQVEDSDDE